MNKIPFYIAIALTSVGTCLMLGMAVTQRDFTTPALIFLFAALISIAVLALMDYGKARSQGVWGTAALMWLTPHAGLTSLVLFFFGVGIALALSGVR
jgi:hypothetical protein